MANGYNYQLFFGPHPRPSPTVSNYNMYMCSVLFGVFSKKKSTVVPEFFFSPGLSNFFQSPSRFFFSVLISSFYILKKVVIYIYFLFGPLFFYAQAFRIHLESLQTRGGETARERKVESLAFYRISSFLQLKV